MTGRSLFQTLATPSKADVPPLKAILHMNLQNPSVLEHFTQTSALLQAPTR